ncbi:hypothetical protein N9B90_01235 [bacterium]|nr:hypothetical protein [bacterium]
MIKSDSTMVVSHFVEGIETRHPVMAGLAMAELATAEMGSVTT